MKRFLSSPFFLLAGLAFFLPFVTVSCASGLGDQFTQGLEEAFGEEAQIPEGDLEESLTGIDIVMGETSETGDTGVPGVEGVPTPAAPEAQETGDNSQLWAIIALAAAALGIFLSLLPVGAGPLLAIILGLAGAVTLFLVRVEIDGSIPAEAESFIDVRYEYGFWAALILFVIAALTGVFRLLSRDRPAVTAPAAPAAGATASGFGTAAPRRPAPPPAAPPPAAPPPPPPPPSQPPPP
jgi:hypothetical protein